MSDDDDGAALLIDELSQQAAEHLPGDRIQAAGGLIGEHQIGIGDQGAGDGDPLLLAARERVGVVRAAIDDVEAIKQPIDARLGVGHAHHRQANIVFGRQGRDQVEGLEHQPDVSAAKARQVRHLDPDNGPKPCIRRFNTNNTFDPDYTIDLNALAGAPAGSLAITASGQALIHVLDEDAIAPLIADGSVANARSFSSSLTWRTARLTLGDSPSVTLLDTPLRTASVLQFTLSDGLVVTPSFERDAKIVEVTDEGIITTSKTGAALSGLTFSVFQIR